MNQLKLLMIFLIFHYICIFLIPIHLDIFSDLVEEGCNILTHHVPSNVVYHILETKVLIDGNMLKLLGDEKRYYHEYFGWNDIIKKTKRH